MNQIITTFNQERLYFQKRYAEFYRKYKANPEDLDTRGHLNECSFLLIRVFGLSPVQILELQRDGCGMTDFDLENARCNI